jgi:hypothetical protein
MLLVDGMNKPADKKPPARPTPITSEILLVAIDQEARVAADDFDDEEITQKLIVCAR